MPAVLYNDRFQTHRVGTDRRGLALCRMILQMTGMGGLNGGLAQRQNVSDERSVSRQQDKDIWHTSLMAQHSQVPMARHEDL